MSDSEDPIDALDETGGDDLFGDSGDDESRAPRVLDDDDLASDPDEDPDARRREYEDEDAQPHETRDRVVMGVQTYRHQIPTPKDGTVWEPRFFTAHCQLQHKLTVYLATRHASPKIHQIHARGIRRGYLSTNRLRHRQCEIRPP